MQGGSAKGTKTRLTRRLLRHQQQPARKTVAVVGVEKGWVIYQLDVRADIDFQVFMKLPEGCGDKSGKVVRLSKGVYGLHQGAFLWSMSTDRPRWYGAVQSGPVCFSTQEG